MPDQKIILTPGINSEATPTLNSTGWSSCNLIRWQDGLLQVLGGWQAFNATPVVGTARSMHPWGDLDNNLYLAVGTNERLQLYSAGTQYDITPIRKTSTLTSAFSTTALSATISVHDVGHGAVVGDWVQLVIELAIGGIVLWDFYQVTSVPDADHYTFTAASATTSTVSGGGLTPNFATTNTSSTVTVTLANHGYKPGNIFTIWVSTSVGGLTLVGEQLITTVPDANTFTFTAGGTASSTTSAYENGGNEKVNYLLASGYASSVTLTGYGAGGYGLGGYGVASTSTAMVPPRIWSLDNFGELLLANPTDLGLYVWTPPPAWDNVATSVATAPTMNTGMFVAMPQAQVIVYGAETGGTQDLLLIRWSDNGSYTDFTATVTNQAGSYRLSRGSRIVGGLQAAQTALIWTDVDLWAMVYQGTPFVYSITTIAQNCGLIAQNAATVMGSNVYWMSLKGFFLMQGNSVGQLPCPVWDQIFADLDTDNEDKCIAAADTPFNEVFFFYPSASGGTGEIDSYVKLNITGNIALFGGVVKTGQLLWDFGKLERTAWIDQSLFGMPLGVDANGIVQQHEMGYTANGSPMTGAYAQSGYADITQGMDFPFVDQIIPDLRYYDSAATATFSIIGTDYPLGTTTTYGPYNVNTSTTLINPRARKRQLAFRIDFDGEHFVRLGAVRYRMAPSGRSVGRA